jgi:GNAT superfamily N-acetyltransferase
MSSQLDFLTDVLGAEGARALVRASEQEPILRGLLVPRAALAWVHNTNEFKGFLPGTKASLEFKKSEKGLSGSLDLDGTPFEFVDSSPQHLAAAISVAVGVDTVEAAPKDGALVKLGKSIDTLVGVRAERLQKKLLDPNLGYQITHEHHDLGDGEKLTQINAMHGGKRVGWALMTHQGASLHPDDVNVDPSHRRKGLASAMYAHAEKVTGKTVAPSQAQQDPGKALWAGNAAKPQFGVTKAELPGQTAKPQQQQGPMEAEQPKKQPRMQRPPKLPKMPSLKVEKSEMSRVCPDCGGKYFEVLATGT